MTVYRTERLEIKEMTWSGQEFFIELLSAPVIIEPIPQPKWDLSEIISKFIEFIDYATVTIKHQIQFCFQELGLDLITSDVSIENIALIKVLDFFYT